MESCAWCHGDKSGGNPELRNVTSKAKRKAAVPSPAGTGGGSPGGGSPGAGSGGGSPPTDHRPATRTLRSGEGTRR
jgi:hypothetical protein